MKPVRRKIRRHFGLTAKQVAVRSHRPWYFQALLYAGLILAGFLLAYWQLNAGAYAELNQKLKQSLDENQTLQTRLVNVQSQLQVEKATSEQLAKELTKAQDDSLKMKEDVIFYKNMLENKTAGKKR